MAYVPTLKKMYKEQVVPALVKQFGYSSVMQVPVLEKIVINQGLGQAVGDKKIIETAIEELDEDHRSESRYDPFQEGYLELQAAQGHAYRRARDAASQQDV